MFGQYMALSRIKFLWIPSGEWARVDAELLALGGVTSEGSGWLVWREIATGMALRRGNLDAADDGLRMDREGGCEWRAAAHHPDGVRGLCPGGSRGRSTDRPLDHRDVLEVVGDRLPWAPLASAAIPRAAFTWVTHDLLRRVDDALAHKAETARYARAVSVTSRGLRLCRGPSR